MMKLQFISEDALQDLRLNFNDNVQHYYQLDKEWFQNYLSEPGRLIESKIDFVMPQFYLDEDYLVSDGQNVKIVYEALKHLTISQATQERLWVGLAHQQLRDFMFYRIAKDAKIKKDQQIKSAMFFEWGHKRSLFVHKLSRLWWTGYMTYDEENKDNPYWLTDFFCEADFSARAVLFFSSNFNSNDVIRKGVLKALIQLKQEGIEIKRDHFVEACRYFNVVGGATILDLLSEKEIKEMALTRLRKVFTLELVM
ncbi:DUF6339 family protein [Viridibacillus sp. NPDC093762]|uniref:DUF6339 family protein n=1 Tax=Viridibacillus sp. NPDC093762 TaxID=3390720 RepID=UPI003CFE5498